MTAASPARARTTWTATAAGRNRCRAPRSWAARTSCPAPAHRRSSRAPLSLHRRRRGSGGRVAGQEALLAQLRDEPRGRGAGVRRDGPRPAGRRPPPRRRTARQPGGCGDSPAPGRPGPRGRAPPGPPPTNPAAPGTPGRGRGCRLHRTVIVIGNAFLVRPLAGPGPQARPRQPFSCQAPAGYGWPTPNVRRDG